MIGLHGLTAWWQLIDFGDIEVAVLRHGQSTWNRCGSHHQGMGRNLGFLVEFRPLLHAETVLLVDDGQAQVLEHHLALDQRVGADHDLHGAIGQASINLPSLPDFGGTRQQGEVDVHVLQLLLKCGKMLCSKDFCRCHQASLEAVVQGQKHHHEGDDGLSATHIALQQTIHLVPRAQVLPDLLDDTLLGVG